ncbi:hypothetical protein LCGC14_1084930, partial [marine sediment metagenome]
LGLDLEEFDGRLEFAERRVRAIRQINFIEDFLSGGKDLTAEGWYVSSHLDWKLVSSPADPSTGFIRIFADTDNSNHLTQIDSSGNEIDLAYLDADAIAAVEGEATLDLTGDVTITGAGKSLEVINLKFETPTELTISAGGDITRTQVFHSVDTNADGGTDNLDGIAGGADGMLLLIRPNNDGRTVIVRHNQNAAATKNILLAGGDNATLDDISDTLLLLYDAALDTNGAWVELARATEASVYTDADAISAVEGESTLDLTGDVSIAVGKSLVVDTINEKGSGTGVTIEGTLLKDSLVDGIALAEQSAAYNGTFVEPMTFIVTSNGTVITGTLDKNPSGDLTEVFSDGYTAMSSGATVTLTVGSATVPKKNYIYVLQSNKGVLVASTSDWPAAEHIKVAEVVVQTAALVQSDGILANRNWNDFRAGTDGQGHHAHTWERLRWEHSAYKSGSAVTWSGSGTAALDLAITAGKAYQMHLHSVAAFNTTDPDNVYVPNHPTAYTSTADIETLTVDSGNFSLSNKYYNLVIWLSVSSGSETEKVFINLPSGSYGKQSDAENDVSGYDSYDIPEDYRGYSYLVQRVTIKHAPAAGGTWTIGQVTDLRGTVPGIAVGGGALATTTEFSDNAFKLFDEGDPTKELAFQVSGVSASTTRTITVPDENVSLIDDATSDPLIDADAAADGTEGSLARKDHVHPKHHAKYLDSAAIAAVEGEATLDLTGDVSIQDGTASKTLSILVTGDANPKMKLSKDMLEFGPGGASVLDTTLKRVGVGTFEMTRTSDGAYFEGKISGDTFPQIRLGTAALDFGPGGGSDTDITIGTGTIFATRVLALTTSSTGILADDSSFSDFLTADTVLSRLALRLFSVSSGGGKDANARAHYAHDRIEFGAGGASALDVNLYRNAASELKTDDKFLVALDLDVGGNIIVSGTVDGVDIAARDHAVYTDAEALAAALAGASIADNTLLRVDGTSNSGEFAQFTAAGLVGRTNAETLSDIGAAAAAHAMSTHSDDDSYAISTSGTATFGDLTLQGSLIQAWGDLTISSGQVAVTKMMHTLAGEGAAADNLVGMSGGSDGMMVILHAVIDSVTITLKHNDVGGESSNGTRLFMASGADVTLDDIDDLAIAVFDSSLDTGGAWIVQTSGAYTDAEAITAVEGEATLALSGAVEITGILTVDTINEKTSAAGVIVEGVKALDSFVELSEISAPAAPAADKGRLYAAVVETETELYWRRPSAQSANQAQRISGSFAYDTFNRGNSTSIGNLDSGQAWTEDDGDWEIASNTLGVVTAAASASNTIATFPIGYQENIEIWADFQTVAGVNADCGIVFRCTDTDNFVLVRITGSTVGGGNGKLDILDEQSGSLSSRIAVNLSSTLGGSTTMRLHIVATGGNVFAECWRTDTATTSFVSIAASGSWETIADTWAAGLQSGLLVGTRIPNTSDNLLMLSVRTW